MRRGFRFTAVLTLVVLALTGFTRGHGHGHSSGSGGGGCSSHTSSSSSGSGTSGSTGSQSDEDSTVTGDDGSTPRTPARPRSPRTAPATTGSGRYRSGEVTAEVVRCVGTGGADRALVHLHSTRTRSDVFQVRLDFLGSDGGHLSYGSATTRVPAGGTVTVQVAPQAKSVVDRVARCAVDKVTRG
ncbi:hypothetical protein ACFV3R_33390 [Streptomyces sp. NPDC059740]|uniref:hypothetical protein n=1 Tax=Streptomyces sp. NPDC059740 TaxID=3346926 RepID=UPI0036619A69